MLSQSIGKQNIVYHVFGGLGLGVCLFSQGYLSVVITDSGLLLLDVFPRDSWEPSIGMQRVPLFYKLLFLSPSLG